MRLSFPMSISTITRVDAPNTLVVSDCLIESDKSVVTELHSLQDRGWSVFQFGGNNEIGNTKVFAFGMQEFNQLYDLGKNPYGVAIVPNTEKIHWSEQYELASRDIRVSAIAVCSGNYDFCRLKFFHSLVSEGKFCKSKLHWLYGFDNPAEVSAFRCLFSPFVFSRIDMAVCSASFIYSLYGVSFSVYSGIYIPIPGANTSRLFDLGLRDWVTYYLSRDQLRVFQNNFDVVQKFSHGIILADSYVDSVRRYLHIE